MQNLGLFMAATIGFSRVTIMTTASYKVCLLSAAPTSGVTRLIGSLVAFLRSRLVLARYSHPFQLAHP